MKNLIFGTMAFFILFALIFAGCNTPTDPKGPGGSGEDVIFDWGNPGSRNTPGNSPDYPGVMLTLADCPTITGTLGDISDYGQVILEAVLYANDTATDPVAQADGLGHFALLSGNNWGNDKLFDQVNNMKVNGATSGVISSDKTEKPVYLLVQTASNSGVGSIEIRKLTLKPKGNSVVLTKVYGSNIEVNGNEITFNNAENNQGAAFYKFSTSELENLGSKTVTVAYTVVDYSPDPTVEQQLVIQAAGSGNGEANTDGGSQWYPVLTTPSGTFDLSGNTLLDRANAKSFTLTGFRIANNGGTTDANPPGKTRQLSYTLVIDSVTVK